MSIRSFIPNAFTSLNLAFGCLAIIEIFEGRLENVIYYTVLSGVVDFFDGFLARLLKSTSNIGKDLDSLADMVSFGVVPALVVYKMLQTSTPGTYWPYVAVLIAVMSGLRLAKFNNDTRQSDRFFGLPTPANACLINSLAYLAAVGIWTEYLNQWIVLVGLAIGTSILLIADIPMMAFKFKKLGRKGNEGKYAFLLISLAMIVLLKLVAIPLIIVLYIVGSIVGHIFTPK
ncbi:CDP-diacylglycerol--serine O-phosphatidyltransferase [Reichenbachiella carrageenanivorans]|uniref:CDP-diacylglycerol--serine O-phosphatidyltransferase n=1 Tax=Reichenbachiella carrageenanivorans TaxID=2979869 RepID=A0ABY6D2P5_9BACT|nr:CDP-diacylglycerol--serine O-phosphatidyltransferase [Reichenbachiella carrageenanivorans]UXX80393.1 CDP-diacylglycerol--serine O-phosphatidyltransferase [Reichenbachiella carrageenanivorans]